jgi:hypothetical protein
MKLDKVDLKNWEYIRIADGTIGAILQGTDRVMINNSKKHREVLDNKFRREGNIWYNDNEEMAEIKYGRIYTWVEVIHNVFGDVNE